MRQYPSIIAVSPSDGMLDVPVDSRVQVRFSLDMNSESIIASTFYLARVRDNFTVPCEPPVYSQQERIATLQPRELLEPNTEYTVTLVGATPLTGANIQAEGSIVVCDILQYPLQATYSWTFVTGSTQHEVPPVLVYPKDGDVCSPSVGFAWADAQMLCRVQIAYTADFVNLVAEHTMESGTVLSDCLPNGTYWWRARAENGAVWSQGVCFSIVSAPVIIDDFEPRLVDTSVGLGFPLDTDTITLEFPGRCPDIALANVSMVGSALLPGVEAHGVVPIASVDTEVKERPMLRTIVTIRLGK